MKILTGKTRTRAMDKVVRNMTGKIVHGSLALSFIIGLGMFYHILYNPPAWMQGGKVSRGSGHYIEVWIYASECIVVGGDQCQ